MRIFFKIVNFIGLPKLASDTTTNNLVNSGFLYLHRLENISYESNLEDKRSTLEEKITQYKLDQKKIYMQLGSLKKEIEDLTIDIDFLGNFYKFTSLQQKINNMSSTYSNNQNIQMALRKKSVNDSGSYDKMMLMKKYVDVR